MNNLDIFGKLRHNFLLSPLFVESGNSKEIRGTLSLKVLEP